MILIGIVMFSHAKQSVFEILSDSWAMRKSVWKIIKKRYNFKTFDDFWSNIWRKDYKISSQLVTKFKVYIFWTNWDITHQTALRPGRVGPDRAGSSRILIVWSRRNFFFSKRYRKNWIVPEIACCLKLPYECRNKLSTASLLHVARNLVYMAPCTSSCVACVLNQTLQFIISYTTGFPWFSKS